MVSETAILRIRSRRYHLRLIYCYQTSQLMAFELSAQVRSINFRKYDPKSLICAAGWPYSCRLCGSSIFYMPNSDDGAGQISHLISKVFSTRYPPLTRMVWLSWLFRERRLHVFPPNRDSARENLLDAGASRSDRGGREALIVCLILWLHFSLWSRSHSTMQPRAVRNNQLELNLQVRASRSRCWGAGRSASKRVPKK